MNEEITMQKSKSTQIKGVVKTYESKTGADIREYVKSAKYTGPTKSGLWIPIEHWDEFKALVDKMDTQVKATRAKMPVSATVSAPAAKVVA